MILFFTASGNKLKIIKRKAMKKNKKTKLNLYLKIKKKIEFIFKKIIHFEFWFKIQNFKINSSHIRRINVTLTIIDFRFFFSIEIDNYR